MKVLVGINKTTLQDVINWCTGRSTGHKTGPISYNNVNWHNKKGVNPKSMRATKRACK